MSSAPLACSKCGMGMVAGYATLIGDAGTQLAWTEKGLETVFYFFTKPADHIIIKVESMFSKAPTHRCHRCPGCGCVFMEATPVPM